MSGIHRGNGPYLDEMGVRKEQVSPCPFCPSSWTSLTVEPGGYIHCVGCGADGPEVEPNRRDARDTLERALPAWNKRRIP